jgi:hypothetical protein
MSQSLPYPLNILPKIPLTEVSIKITSYVRKRNAIGNKNKGLDNAIANETWLVDRLGIKYATHLWFLSIMIHA